MTLVYKVVGHKTGRLYEYDHGSILTTEKPDDVDRPCGYIERVKGNQVYRPFGTPTNKEVYLNPFTNRWE